MPHQESADLHSGLHILLLLTTFVVLSIAGCGPAGIDSTDTVDAEKSLRGDPHSFAEPDVAVVEHLDLELHVDFAARKISGRASMRVNNRSGTNRLVLDTRDLDIERVTLGDERRETSFALGDPGADPSLGRPLEIVIAPDTRLVHVEYATRPEAAALQWLEPPQTAGGKSPFLYTQGQAILTRTWIPCQDTPAVRMTFDASVHVPAGLMAVMSAENPTEPAADGLFRFHMPQPVPAYLIALAVGELEFASLGPRSGVYAEPGLLSAATHEFADTEKMIDANVQLYGPYRWGRYDILVLPPSFPFGGMENPRLTFATPTILAGDRSLNALIAHELAHSWSGNLVTNATWSDLWLNEGFTVYVERRVVEELYGKEYADMQALLGMQDLVLAIEELGADSPDTRLKIDVSGRDPDDAFSDVPYEKGYFFLRNIEDTVGRVRFDAFLREYFDAYAFRSLSTEEFLAYLNEELIAGDEQRAESLRIDFWVYGPGLPDDAPQIVSDAFERVDVQIAAWQSGTPAARLSTDGWNTPQWLHFVRNLPERLGTEKMAELDAAFGFNDSGNSEILAAWLLHVIANRFEPGFESLESLLTRQGRRKFLKPLYTELAKTEAGKARAIEIYERARPMYHSVSTGTIDEILGWSGN